MAFRMISNRNLNLFNPTGVDAAEATSARPRRTDDDRDDANNLELQTHPTQTTTINGDVGPADPLPLPNADPRAGGDNANTSRPFIRRGQSGARSVMNNLSTRMHNLRTRDRSEDPTVAANRRHLAEELHDVEAQLGGVGPAGGSGPAAATGTAGATRSSKQKDSKARKEREEASTLFGPNLAHYFGSGSSSSGAVAGPPVGSSGNNAASSNPQAPTSPGVPATPGPDASSPTQQTAPDTPGTPFPAQTKSARLGSRGRARGASLSGLSKMIWGQEEGGKPTEEAASALPQADVQIDSAAMAEGIDIEVLKAWIEKSASSGGAVEVQGTGEEAVQKAMKTPSQCSTLQSFVNLKRNTINLMMENYDVGVHASQTQENAGQGNPDDPLGSNGAPASRPPHLQVVDESELRPARSLSNMPAYGAAESVAGPSSMGATTHNLHFEYDCTSPSASIQVFVRASRKHGSWTAWEQAQRDSAEAGVDSGSSAADSLFVKWGPPPHVLGWPVHSSLVRGGFAQPVKASLALRIGLYAPPTSNAGKDSANAASSAAPQSDGRTDGVEGASKEGGDETEDQAGQQQQSQVSLAYPAQAGLAPIPENETKEQRAAREKSERETLKVAIVVEALDTDNKPFSEPNLQTTYLRLTSLPVRRNPMAATEGSHAGPPAPGLEPVSEGDTSAAEGEDAGQGSDVGASTAQASSAAPGSTQDTTSSTPPQRIWTAHVEGQEAEIGPHRFQLQELYGLSSRPPPVQIDDSTAAGGAGGAGGEGEDQGPPLDMSAAADGMSGSECLICLSSPVNTILLPCTHGLCLDCSVQLKDSVKAQRDTERRRGKTPKKRWNCPMCRRAFNSMLHLSWGDDAQEGGLDAAQQQRGDAPGVFVVGDA